MLGHGPNLTVVTGDVLGHGTNLTVVAGDVLGHGPNLTVVTGETGEGASHPQTSSVHWWKKLK